MKDPRGVRLPGNSTTGVPQKAGSNLARSRRVVYAAGRDPAARRGALIIFISILFTAVSMPVQDTGAIQVVSIYRCGRNDHYSFFVMKAKWLEWISA